MLRLRRDEEMKKRLEIDGRTERTVLHVLDQIDASVNKFPVPTLDIG